MCGIFAALGNTTGTLLSNYAATKGLGGPSSAMVQIQCVFHTTLSALFLGVFPNKL